MDGWNLTRELRKEERSAADYLVWVPSPEQVQGASDDVPTWVTPA